MAEQYKTGGDCDAWCTKCKMDLAHTIVAMVAGKPVQVKCNTCHSFHKYRAPQATKTARGSSSRSSSGSAASKPRAASTTRAEKLVIAAADDARRRWNEAMSSAGSGPQRPYDVREVYAEGDVVTHPTFGTGIVLELVSHNRMRTLFANAERVLIMAHGARPPEQV